MLLLFDDRVLAALKKYLSGEVGYASGRGDGVTGGGNCDIP